MKFSKFVANPMVEVLMANKTTSEAGLHGRTIKSYSVGNKLSKYWAYGC